MGGSDLTEYYDDYPRIEEELNAALAESLDPRGPDHVYEVVAGLGLPAGATVLDLGCGEGDQAVVLATRFGFSVVGVDPVERHLELAREALPVGRFELGTAEALPLDDDSVDLVWCREVLYHVPDLVAALRECRRVLRPDGRMVLYQLYSTDRLEPNEAAWFWGTNETIPRNADRAFVESSIADAGLHIVETIELGSETGEWAEEHHGKAGRELLAAARLLRRPEVYVERFGQAAVDIKLADALWHVFRMIGKLANRIDVLAP